jgi:SpoVK/Ycf46/Vps4 family AAA+-type ATPase
MEEHEGVTVLATNRLGDLDEAFLRRFHILLRFPMPNTAQRLRLWQGLLPPDMPGSNEIRESPQLHRLAEVFEISGGEIRNAALAAAFMAATRGEPLHPRDLKRALGREFTKSGRILDQRQRRELDDA